MLLSRQGDVGESFEEVAGDVALEGAECFALGLAFADPSVELGASCRVVFGPDDRDGVDRVVDLAVRAKAASCLNRVGSQARSLAAEMGPIPARGGCRRANGRVRRACARGVWRLRRVRVRSAVVERRAFSSALRRGEDPANVAGSIDVTRPIAGYPPRSATYDGVGDARPSLSTTASSGSKARRAAARSSSHTFPSAAVGTPVTSGAKLGSYSRVSLDDLFDTAGGTDEQEGQDLRGSLVA
jgi:hypothetical protein